MCDSRVQSGAHVEWVAELVLRPGGLDLLSSGLSLHSVSVPSEGTACVWVQPCSSA